MAARPFLQRQRANGSILVDGEVVKERFVGIGEIFSCEGPSGFFSCKTGLDRSGDHANGRLSAQHFQQVGVCNQRTLVDMERFSGVADGL